MRKGVYTSYTPIAVDGETILVVEDQQNVRQMVVRLLSRLGYQVLEAENGKAALNILEHSKSIDLILSDMVMPGGIGGEEVVSQALEIMPNLKALLMSGNAIRSDAADGRLETPILQKPFRKVELARALRDCLDGK